MNLALALVAVFAPQEPPVVAPALASASAKAPADVSVYSGSVGALDGETFDLSSLRGKVTLVVNVASACGYTPQYAGLQRLHEELAPQGFTVLGFPSNDFGGQEPGTAAEIREFCTENYGVTFPLLAKVQVKAGETQAPVYQRLQQLTGELPKWNFGKYVVARDGKRAWFFPTRTAPDDPKLREAIDAALKTPLPLTGVLDEKEFAALHELRKDAPPALRGEMVPLRDGKAYLSLPQGKEAPLPGVILIHEWYGLNDHIKHWADRLAADGYAALAVDLYGGVVATDRETASKAMQSVDEANAQGVLNAAMKFLGEDPRVRARKRACIGWCFGGMWSLRCAIAEPELSAAVIYYGRLVTDPEQLASIRAPVLGIFGTRDRGIPPAAVDAFENAMKTAGREVRILRYDAEHAFANPSGARYDHEHAAAAWAQARAFLARQLK